MNLITPVVTFLKMIIREVRSSLVAFLAAEIRATGRSMLLEEASQADSSPANSGFAEHLFSLRPLRSAVNS